MARANAKSKATCRSNFANPAVTKILADKSVLDVARMDAEVKALLNKTLGSYSGDYRGNVRRIITGTLEETGDLLFQGWTVTDPHVLADSGTHSPLADNESLVRLPARMRDTILEALHGHGAAVQRADRGDDDLSRAPGDAGRLYA
jgi:hypothetical protein